jgi:hypothetical protein
MSDQDTPSPFLRVPSRSEKYSTLLLNAVLAVSSGSVMFWIMDVDLRNPATWMCGYGSVFFGTNTLHSWRSIKKGWNIREDNEDFYSPLFAWTTSKWLFLAILLGWLGARHWL